MNCQDADAALDALLDGELAPEARRQALAHLESCAACRGEFAYRQRLRRAIRQAGEGVEVPAELWARIRAGLEAIDRQRQARRPRRRPWAALAGAAMAAVLLGVLLGQMLWRPPVSPFMAESVDNYIRYLLPGAPYELQTDDAARIRHWLQGRVDFLVEPPDLSGLGFQLAGARLGYFLGRPVAEVGYRSGQHRLSLFMAKALGDDRLAGRRVAVGGTEFFLAASKGYSVVAWRDAPANLVCSIVADLSPEQLLRLARAAARLSS
jgi:anti-sigma factor (TIGR02949 family)